MEVYAGSNLDFSHSFCCHSVPTACLQCCWLCWHPTCWSVESNVLKFTCGNKCQKKTYIIEKQWKTLRKFRSVFAKLSTQRLATDSGQVANKFGELFQGKALIIHDATKSSTDHWRIERQLQIKARGRSNQVECRVFDDFFQPVSGVGKRCQPGLFCSHRSTGMTAFVEAVGRMSAVPWHIPSAATMPHPFGLRLKICYQKTCPVFNMGYPP